MPDEILRQTRSLFLSAGHSDRDPGAVGHGMSEADIVLDLRDRLADHLAERVVVSRDGAPGQNLPLSLAVNAAARHTIAVELHCNAADDPRASGVETLSRPRDYPLGRALCAATATILGIPDRGAKDEGSGQHSRLAFVADGGGILLELFFLSNPDDLKRYRKRRQALVEALAQVLVEAVCPEDSGEARDAAL